MELEFKFENLELARVANSPLSTFMRALEEGEERADTQSLPPSEISEEND